MIDLNAVKFYDLTTIDKISSKKGFEFRKKNFLLIRNFEDIIRAGRIGIQLLIQIQSMRKKQNRKITDCPQRTAKIRAGNVGIGCFNDRQICVDG